MEETTGPTRGDDDSRDHGLSDREPSCWHGAGCLIAGYRSSITSLERRQNGRRFLVSGRLNVCGLSAFPGSGLSSQSGMCRCIMSSENGSRNVSKRSFPDWDCSAHNAVNRLGVPADAPLLFSSGS